MATNAGKEYITKKIPKLKNKYKYIHTWIHMLCSRILVGTWTNAHAARKKLIRPQQKQRKGAAVVHIFHMQKNKKKLSIS